MGVTEGTSLSPVSMACGDVLSLANASRPRAEHLTLRGVKIWPHSRLPPEPWGSSGQNGVWVLGLAPGETAEGSPEPPPLRLSSEVQTPAAQCVPLQAACHPLPLQFPVAGGQLGRGWEETLLMLSDLQSIWE